MGQIVLWDKFSHKGNKSLIALLDFISNTGEYIIMVCHAQKVVDQMFQGCQCILQERLPLRFPILQDLVREAPPHAKDTTPSKYLGLQTDGEFVKGFACWPQQTPSLQIY